MNLTLIRTHTKISINFLGNVGLVLLLLLLLGYYNNHSHAQPAQCFDAYIGSPPTNLPLCGNNILDPGEICDDGNKVNGDGCNAFCSAFDAMTTAATLAGSTAQCPPQSGQPVLGGTTSNTIFCNLRAIDTALDGSYVILADNNMLLRMDLFTDKLDGTITQLEASIDHVFGAICSVAVLAPDASILIHDCAKQQFWVAMHDGSHVQPVVDWSSLIAPTVSKNSFNFKAFYDKSSRSAVVAAPTLMQSPTACIQILKLNISHFNGAYISAVTNGVIAEIPCTLYGVWEGGTKIISFDARGMEPYQVTREICASTFRPGQICYVVYMQRTSHMDFLKAFVPEQGGIDLEYYASTTNLMDNALGPQLIRFGGGGLLPSNNLVYTLRASCFQMESRIILSMQGKSPPIVTLGNACKQAPMLGPKCSLPFNNPFITDIMTSPILLPDGLSATHTHLELSQIFSAQVLLLLLLLSVKQQKN